MLHFSPLKIAITLLICLIGLVFSLPNFFAKETVAAWPSFVPKRQMPLGLDLQGGAHLLLAMDTNELKRDWLANLRDDARKQLREAKIGFTGIGVANNAVVVRLAKTEDADKALVEIRKLNTPLGSALLGTSGNTLEIVSSEPGVITVTPTEPGFLARVTQAAEAAIVTVNNRVNQLGTSESTVVRQGSDRILVQFPGLQDTKQLKAILGETAKLTFHEVHPQMTPEEAKSTRIPVGYRVYPADAKERGASSYLLRETPVVPGEDLTDAQPGFDQRTNEAIISFRFNQAGARKFGKFTSENVGRPFAIVLDGKVLSAPVIREPILGGSGQISGSFTVETANTLAISLRSGALPAKLTIVEERTVGPSLGADSVSAGLTAGIVGALATLVLTVLYYGTFGIFACVGLVVHGLMTVAIMSMIGSTLTLPGIAGLVLGVAMAVDANVLIYERIREELRAGRTPIAAIDAGFTRAFITIADSQLTTLACAIVMFWLGSGPIRGFAVTLSIGIVTAIFASVTVVRLVISLWLKSEMRGKRTIEVPV